MDALDGRGAAQGPVVRSEVCAGGHRISCLVAGPEDGPAVVLLHGLASDAETWDRTLEPLAGRGLRVYAVDLLGHGRSDKPAGTYLLEDFAESVHEVLDALGLERAVLAGHSLGGAIAMATAHRYPQRCAGLVLVAAGGLGREVHPVLRAASLPVATHVVRWAMGERARRLYRRPGLHRALGLTPDNLTNLRRAGRALGTTAGQASFFASLRGVIGPRGQLGSFIDMDLLAADVPTLLVWNERDPVVPVSHGRAARRHLPRSKLVVFPGTGHEPHRRHPQWFADEVADFVLDPRW